ncbi:MAG: hypothetical protein CVU50_07425 [Candidatus Cloacimonetes bacterium HGW-Cloacimonetes-3]|jgi:predicted nucleotidyltransferase|nr:MAG: hypothetical protein CVU50_07425 [Candidatus Cloacimonetes bacterium HGW-Cloacimonetes-3]
MDKFGIPNEYWESIISTIKACKHVKQINLFGSRAKGNYKTGSDIDLALMGEDISAKDILSLYVALDTLDLPWKIDLINYHSITEIALIEHIVRCGIVVG